MAVYTAKQIGATAPTGGFQQGGWYNGSQYWNGTFSEPGVIHPESNQQGAGQLVSAEVNAQSAGQQNVTPQQLEDYLAQQRAKLQSVQPTQTASSPYKAGSGASTASRASGATGSLEGLNSALNAKPSIDLPGLYQNLYQSSGISDKESSLRTLEQQYLEARGKISDNPFLSASMIDQRLQRLQRKYEEQTTPLRNEIATAKADIETQLNLQTKQFDINSQQAQQALSTFNTLLNAGALDTASGEDVASITLATGIPSSMIYSAIDARNKKNMDLAISTFTADSGEVTAVAIDKETGTVVSKTSLGLIGNAQTSGGSGGGTVTERLKAQEEEARQAVIQSIKNYNNLADIIGAFSQYLSVEEIYRLYNTYSPFGTAKETLEEAEQGIFTEPARY